ncbi:MAG: transposase [Leptolyngbyaceae cyanobacterium]
MSNPTESLGLRSRTGARVDARAHRQTLWRSRLIRQELFEELCKRGLELVTNYKKKMKNKLVKLLDRGMRRKRALIETVNDPLKNIFQIEHSRHRSPLNFLAHTLAALVAYTYQEKKPALDLEFKGLTALPPAIFQSVNLVSQTYYTDVKLTRKAMTELEKKLRRLPGLEK